MSAYHDGQKARRHDEPETKVPVRDPEYMRDWRRGWRDQDREVKALSPDPADPMWDKVG